MTDNKKFEELDAIARKAYQANQSFQQTSKDAYQFARQSYADPKYNAFRDSDEGRLWKKEQIKRYGHRCPECNKLINNNNSNIDHKHSRRLYPWLAWDVTNLWVMCSNCNRAKGCLEWDEYLVKVRAERGDAALKRILKFAPTRELE